MLVEFAVNDGRADENILRSMEGIVRQVWNTSPETDIVFVYTVTKSIAQNTYEKGKDPKNVLLHQKIADHYGIPSINAGKDLWQLIHNGKETWETMTIDSVHPTDAGYAVYTQSILKFFEAELHKPCDAGLFRELPEPLTEKPFEKVCLFDSWNVKCDGWIKSEHEMSKKNVHLISCNLPGTGLDFEFYGTVIGLFYLISPDSGDIAWSIDDGKPERHSLWDHYALRFERAAYSVFRDNLEEGKHSLHLKILSENNVRSAGTWIRIGAFLTEEFGK